LLLTPGFLLSTWCPLNAVAWCQANLEFNDLVPYRVSTLMVGNGQQLPQATTRIGRRRFVAYRLGGRLLDGRGLQGRLFYGLFFAHFYIIARIMHSNPVLAFASNAMWVFSYGRCA
jgi:hypothetical protein